MKKIILMMSVVVIILGLYYFMSDSEETIELPAPTSQQSLRENDSSNEFSWSTTITSTGSEGGSDYIPSSNLELRHGGEAYQISDYLDSTLAGCSSMEQYAKNNQIDSILIQYDEGYEKSFLDSFVTYYLCPIMAGGDLIVVRETPSNFLVQHYVFGDGYAPFTQAEPTTLFSVPK